MYKRQVISLVSCVLFSTVPYDDQLDRPNNMKLVIEMEIHVESVIDSVIRWCSRLRSCYVYVNVHVYVKFLLCIKSQLQS